MRKPRRVTREDYRAGGRALANDMARDAATFKYDLVDKHPAYEVWQGDVMLSRHPNRPEALAAIKRYRDGDARELRRK